MDPGNIPFKALIVGPTNSGKTQFLVNQPAAPSAPCLIASCSSARPSLITRHSWLKVASLFWEGTNTLIVLDDGAASKDVKGQTAELFKLGFTSRHACISVRVLTQQLSSIANLFRENVVAIVLFYTPSAKTTKAICEEYAGELSQDEPKAADCKAERV